MSLWCLPPVVLDEVVDAKGTVWQDHDVSKTDVLEVGEVQGKVGGELAFTVSPDEHRPVFRGRGWCEWLVGVEEGLAMESFAEGLLDKIVSVLSIDLVSLAFCRELVEDNVLDRVFRGEVLVGVGIRPRGLDELGDEFVPEVPKNWGFIFHTGVGDRGFIWF